MDTTTGTGVPAVAPERVAAGLATAEARRRLATAGPNALPTPRGPTVWRPLLAQFTHFFALMLWVATGLAVLAGLPQLAVAIAIVVVVNGGFAFAQEYRADRAADRLRDLMPAEVAVRRDGRRHTVPAADLVPGDVVLLEAGDRVCADLRGLRARGLAVDESLLTGESVPRRAGVGDALYAGTFVVEGAGEAVVERTGTGTRLAAIATLTRQTRRWRRFSVVVGRPRWAGRWPRQRYPWSCSPTPRTRRCCAAALPAEGPSGPTRRGTVDSGPRQPLASP